MPVVAAVVPIVPIVPPTPTHPTAAVFTTDAAAVLAAAFELVATLAPTSADAARRAANAARTRWRSSLPGKCTVRAASSTARARGVRSLIVASVDLARDDVQSLDRN